MSLDSNKNAIKVIKQSVRDYISSNSNGDRNKTNEGRWFCHWYFTTFYPNLSKTTIMNTITDCTGDENIDALFYDKNKQLLNIYQFKFVFSASEQKSISRKEVAEYVVGIKWLLNELREPSNTLKETKIGKAIKKISPLMKKNKIKKFNYYIIVGNSFILKINLDRATKPLSDYVAEQNKPKKKVNECIYTLQNLYTCYPTIIIKKPIESILLTPKSETIEIQESNGFKSFSFAVEATELARLYNNYNLSLLKRNVRVPITESEVNKAIYETCTDRTKSGNFLYFNNGITFIAKDVDVTNMEDYELFNPQIVNGGQTIKSLAKALLEKGELQLQENTLVQVRILETGADSYLETEISYALNYQNQIDYLTLISSHDQFIILQNELKNYGYFLERRKGEHDYISNNSRNSEEGNYNIYPKEKVIKFEEGIKAYLAIFCDASVCLKMQSVSQFLSNTKSEDENYERKLKNMGPLDFINAFMLFSKFEGYLYELKQKKKYNSNFEQSNRDFINKIGDAYILAIEGFKVLFSKIIYKTVITKQKFSVLDFFQDFSYELFLELFFYVLFIMHNSIDRIRNLSEMSKDIDKTLSQKDEKLVDVIKIFTVSQLHFSEVLKDISSIEWNFNNPLFPKLNQFVNKLKSKCNGEEQQKRSDHAN